MFLPHIGQPPTLLDSRIFAKKGEAVTGKVAPMYWDPLYLRLLMAVTCIPRLGVINKMVYGEPYMILLIPFSTRDDIIEQFQV